MTVVGLRPSSTLFAFSKVKFVFWRATDGGFGYNACQLVGFSAKSAKILCLTPSIILKFSSALYSLGLALGLVAPLSLPARAASPLPTARLSIADASIYEGNSRYRELLFPVSLSRALPHDVSASFSTKPITAFANSDYTPQINGQIVIKAGQTGANILIRVTGDNIEERDEKFLVQLGRPKRVGIADSDGIGFIQDDDYRGQVSIGDTSLTEGDEGQTLAKIDVSLSTPPLHDLRVRYETKDDSAKASERDYVATHGELVFPRGRRFLPITVPLLSDRDAESDEKFFVQIAASPYNPVAEVTKSLGVITILNDDAPPPLALSVADVAVSEGNNGQSVARFTVVLDAPATREIGVTAATRNGSAYAPGDFEPMWETLIFKVGESSKVVDVLVATDEIEERDETFTLKLFAPGGVSDDEAIATIKDDDYNGGVEIRGNTGDFGNNYSGPEGNAEPQSASFRVSLSQPPLHPIEVTYATQDGTAVAGEDYVAQNGSLSFSPADFASRTVLVPLVNDAVVEPDEKFSLNFLIGGKARFVTSIITILNDDGAPATGNGKIVFDATADFVSTDREIFAMNGDGSGQVRLTFRTGSDSMPGLSRDGKRIVWVASTSVYKPDGAGGGGFIDSYALWTMNADGSDQKMIYQAPENVYLAYPRFSPDGAKIALVSGIAVAFRPKEVGSLVLLSSDGSNPQPVTDGVFATQISFSPDGAKIAFTAAPSGDNFKVGIVNLDGSGKILLDTGGVSDVDPSFSPDGAKIAFSSRRNDTFDSAITIANADGSGATVLVSSDPSGSKRFFQPAFSPDGNRLAFYFGDFIGTINLDGSDQKTLTEGRNPMWGVDAMGGFKAAAATSAAPLKPSAGSS